MLYTFFFLLPFRPYIFALSAFQISRKPSRAKQLKGKEDVYRGDIKYTAQRLYEKGVILEIEGLPPSQLVKRNLGIFMYDLHIHLLKLKTSYTLFLRWKEWFSREWAVLVLLRSFNKCKWYRVRAYLYGFNGIRTMAFKTRIVPPPPPHPHPPLLMLLIIITGTT